MLESPIITVLLSVSIFLRGNIFFMYLGAPVLGAYTFQGSQLALFPWLDQDFQSRAGPPTPRVQGTQLTSDIRAVCDLFHKKENKGHADPQGPSEHAALPCQRSNSPCQHMLVVNSQESRGHPPSLLTQAPAPGPQGRKTMETNGEIQDDPAGG